MESFANNEILNFLWLYRQVLAIVLSTMLLIIAIVKWWDKVKYFFMNMSYGFPVFGKIARSGKDSQVRSDGDWFYSEKMLCEDFYSYYVKHNKNAKFYEKCRDYLSKCQELGRRKKGLLLNLLLVFLILFEAVGFAYVLAPFMVQNVSANDASMLAWFTAFLLSIAAVFLTDNMGKEIHHNSLIKKIRLGFENDRNNPQSLEADNKVKLETTYLDDDRKSYIQMLNRVPHNATVTPTHPWTIITVIYIFIIAIGAFMVRTYTLDSIETESVNNAVSPFVTSGSFSSSASPFELPVEAEAANQLSNQKAENEKNSAVHMASLTTFIILSVIFVAIQVLGIMFGFLYSLSGVESATAWKYTKNFNNAEEFNNYYERHRDQVARDAQAKLSALQERLASRITISGNEREAMIKGFGHKSFDNFLKTKKYNEEQTQISLPQKEVSDSSVNLTGKNVHVIEDKALEKGNVSVLNELGDISNLDDQDLVMLAEELNIDLELLQRKRKIQLIASRNKA